MNPPENQTIIAYLDETYFYRQSGLIQTAIVVPEHQHATILENIAQGILRRDGRREFKASEIKESNVSSYKDFLQAVVNFVHAVGEQSHLRSIIAVDGKIPARKSIFNTLSNQTKTAVSNAGVVVDSELGRLLDDICSQHLWFVDHFNYLCPSPIANSFKIILDDKHKNAATCLQTKFVRSRLGLAWPMEVARIITATFNSLCKTYWKQGRPPVVSEIRYDFSESHCGLQAADIFSNLLYCFLRDEAGIRDRKGRIKLKRNLLSAVIPNLSIVDEVQNELLVRGNQLELRNSGLVSTVTFGPDG